MRNDQHHLSKLFNNSAGDGGLDFLKLLKQESLRKDVAEGTGPYVAYVLRVEEMELGQGFSWADEIKDNFDAEQRKKTNPIPNPLSTQRWVKVYARITSEYLPGQPNIHAYIPMPKQFGSMEDVGTDTRSARLITMHHAFMGNLAEVSAPSPGDFIWVDYLDKRNFNKPVYLKKLTKTPSGAPCLDDTCSPNPFLKPGVTGRELNRTAANPENSNPNSPINNPEERNRDASPGVTAPSSCRDPGIRPYELNGFEAKNFTSFDRFITGQYKSNMELTLSILEVIKFHFENLFPQDTITVNPNKNPGIAYPPPANTVAGKNLHHTAQAIDVEVYKNGSPVDKAIIWASIMKLIVHGVIPDGGVGYYQTNSPKGPNKGIPTTFATNLPASDWPHYDWGDEATRPSKWVEATLNNKKVIYSSTSLGQWSTAPEWINATISGENKMPPSCAQALSDQSTEPCPTLPTVFDVLQARTSASEQDKHNKRSKTIVQPGSAGPQASKGWAGAFKKMFGLKNQTANRTQAPRMIARVTMKDAETEGRWVFTKSSFTGSSKALKEAVKAFETEMAKVTNAKGEKYTSRQIRLLSQKFRKKLKAELELDRMQREYKRIDDHRPSTQKPKKCGLTRKGAFTNNPTQSDIQRLGVNNLNLPPGLIMDPAAMPSPKRLKKTKKLKHVSLFVVHETAVEMDPTAQAYSRVNKIHQGGIKKRAYVTQEESNRRQVDAKIKARRKATNEQLKKDPKYLKASTREQRRQRTDAYIKAGVKKQKFSKNSRTRRKQETEYYDKKKAELGVTDKATYKKHLAKFEEARKTKKAALDELEKEVAKTVALRDAEPKKILDDVGLLVKNPVYAEFAAAVTAGKTLLRKETKAYNKWVQRSKPRTIIKTKVDKKTGEETTVKVVKFRDKGKDRDWSAAANLQWWSGRAGEVITSTPWNHVCWASNWANDWSVANENCLGSGGYVSPNAKRRRSYNRTGGKCIGNNNAFWGPVHPFNIAELHKELGIRGFGWFGSARSRCMPNLTMMERQFQLVQWLDSQHNPLRDIYKGFDANWYPCTINDSKVGPWKTWSASAHKTALQEQIEQAYKEAKKTKIGNEARKHKAGLSAKKDKQEELSKHYRLALLNNNRPLFPWGRWNPGGLNRDYRPSQWEKGKPKNYRGDKSKDEKKYMNRTTRPLRKNFQRGVAAHARWGSHTDGVFIEYYMLGRTVGLTPLAAFYACIGAYCSSATGDYKSGVTDPGKAYRDRHLRLPPGGYTYFPNDLKADYPGLGMRIWHGNAKLPRPSPQAWIGNGGAYGTANSDTSANAAAQHGTNPVDWYMSGNSTYWKEGTEVRIPRYTQDGTTRTGWETIKLGIPRGARPKKSRRLLYKWKRDMKKLTRYSKTSNDPKLKESMEVLKKLIEEEENKYSKFKRYPGPFASKSHFVADRGVRDTVIPTGNWKITNKNSLTSQWWIQNVRYTPSSPGSNDVDW